MAITTREPDAALKNGLQPFLKNNPESRLVGLIFGEKDDGDLRIEAPWGDESLSLFLYYRDNDYDFRMLNSIKLPKLMSAILHLENKRLEVAWTARALSESREEVIGRKFDFIFKGKTYTCYFELSSEKLLFLAARATFRQNSSTLYRNLQSFKDYQEADAGNKERNFGNPLSFFIENFDLSEEDTVEFVQHLNFYMSYYDNQTPYVLLHLSDEAGSSFNRYVRGDFPHTINARLLDPNLLSFWGAIRTTNPMLDFVISYRIIEYASIHFVEHDTLSKINKIISSPSFGGDRVKDMEEIAFVINVKIEEHQRIRSLVSKCCEPIKLWKEIDISRGYFSKDIRFDGGFKQKALILPKDSFENFEKNWAYSISDSFRKLRNALSHGKDMETAGVITPTLRNFELLRPWVHMITTIAGDIILYKDVA